MYDMGAANRNGLWKSQTLEQRKKILAEAAKQRYVEFTGGAAKYTSGTVHELNENSHPIEREFYEFYRTPRGEFTPSGQSPELTTHPTLTSNVKFMNFHPFVDIETISPPRPVVHHGRGGTFTGIQRRRVPEGCRTQGTVLGAQGWTCGPL